MANPWPTDDISLSNVDASVDDPAQARADIANAMQRLKDVINALAAASGVCDLDSSSLVPVARLPAITVPKGGTGLATVTAQGMLVGNGTGNLQVVGPGTAGQVWTSNGAGSPPSWTSGAIPSGNKVWFYQAAAPSGWTIDSSTSDAVLGVGITGVTNGTLGGSWSGTTEAHTLTISEIPAHDHSYTYYTVGGFPGVIQGTGSGGFTNQPNGGTTGQTGGGSGHSHAMTNWRPKTHGGVICVKT